MRGGLHCARARVECARTGAGAHPAATTHERGVRQDADEDDPVFGDAANRDRIEAMVANGNLTEESARKIVDGNVLVAIDVYSRDGEPTRLDVSVY